MKKFRGQYYPPVLVLIFLVLSWTCYAGQLVPVQVEEVKKLEYFDRLEVLGKLSANESVDITATVTDTLTAIHFTDGQQVEAGDILVEMTNNEEHAQLEEEISRHAEALKQFERAEQLVTRGSASQALLDQRKRELATAEARLRAIESRLQDRLIKAPFGGVVGLRNISLGALVEPGDVITTLDDMSVMKLDVNVPSIYLGALTKDTPVAATSPAYPGKQFDGTIRSINSRIDQESRTVTVRSFLDNPEGLLKPGLLMSVELRFNVREAVVIPEEALIPKGEENFVLMVDGSNVPPVASRRRVAIGTRRLGEAEILTGLQPGEKVITHGALKVRPGDTITVTNPETAD